MSDRHPDDLLKSGLAVIDRTCIEHSVWGLIPLFSGGHDSYCACYVASKHKRFKGEVFHIDTGIGSEKTKQFVQQVCDDEGWRLRVYKSTNPRDTYESIVRGGGFPWPQLHSLCYHRLKESCVKRMSRSRGILLRGGKWALITGARQQESVRRMGHIEAIRVGDAQSKGSTQPSPYGLHRLWVNPCYDWSGEEQVSFMNYHRLDRNPVKMSRLAKSGECFCGCFARSYELEVIREVCPDVGEEIDRLADIARKCGVRSVWGNTKVETGQEVAESGPLCNSCDLKMASMGVRIIPQS